MKQVCVSKCSRKQASTVITQCSKIQHANPSTLPLQCYVVQGKDVLAYCEHYYAFVPNFSLSFTTQNVHMNAFSVLYINDEMVWRWATTKIDVWNGEPKRGWLRACYNELYCREYYRRFLRSGFAVTVFHHIWLW